MHSIRVRLSLFLFSLFLVLPALAEQRPVLSPQVRHGVLPNGLQWYVQRNERPAAKVEMRLVVKAGSMQEDDDQLGLAHFAEHMAFNGTKHFEKHQLVSTMQSLGIRMGADLNAFTSFDQTLYVLAVPTDRPQNVELGMQVLADWAGGVTFDPAEIERERGVVLEESRNHKGAGDRMNRVLYPKIFEGSRYAERIAIGKDELLRTFPHDALKRFYRDWYRPNLMAVIVVGDVDPAAAEAMVKRHFGGLTNPVPERPRVYTVIPDRTKEEAIAVTDPEATANILRVIYSHTAEPPSPTLEGFRRKLVKTLFNTLMGQRLQSAARGANPVFTSARIGVRPFVRGYQEFSAEIALSRAGLDAAAAALVQETARVREYGFTATELDRAGKSLLRSAEQAYNERDKTESGVLASVLVQHVLTGEPVPGIEVDYPELRALLPDVKLAEVNEYARQLLGDTERKLVIYQGAQKTGEAVPTPDKLLAAVNARPGTIEAYVDRAPAGKLMDRVPEGGRIVSERQLGKLGVTELTLRNGVKVLLKPTDFKNDQVVFAATRAGGGSRFDDAELDTARFLPSLLDNIGVRQFTPAALQKMFAGKSVQFTPYISETYEGFRGQSGSADVESLLQLAHLFVMNPHFNATLVRGDISRQQDRARNALARPETAFQAAVYQALYDGHPRAPRVPGPEDFDRIDVKRVAELYERRFASVKDFTYVVVGSFDLENMKALVATYLDTLPATELATGYRDTGLRTARGVVRREVRAGAEQKSIISMTFTGETAYSVGDLARLGVLSDLLRIRLTERLRQGMSAIYSPGVAASLTKAPYPHYAVSLNIPCSPENVERVRAAIQAELAAMREEDVAEADLAKVRENRLKSTAEGQRSNQYWVNTLLASRQTGEDPAAMIHPEEHIRKLTPADVRQAARTFLNPANVVEVVLYPEQKG